VAEDATPKTELAEILSDLSKRDPKVARALELQQMIFDGTIESYRARLALEGAAYRRLERRIERMERKKR